MVYVLIFPTAKFSAHLCKALGKHELSNPESTTLLCGWTYLADCLHRQSLDSYRQRPNYRHSTESASYAQRPRHRYQPLQYSTYPHCPFTQVQTPFPSVLCCQTPTDFMFFPFLPAPNFVWCFAGHHHLTSLVSAQISNSISTQFSTHITLASGTMQAHKLSPDSTRPVPTPSLNPDPDLDCYPDPRLARCNLIPHTSASQRMR